MAEKLYWYHTRSGKHPQEFSFYINFQFVGMKREATMWEVDHCDLEEIGFMTRDDFQQAFEGYSV